MADQKPKKPAANKAPKLSKDKVRADQLTQDLQRLQADFENYRKRSETDKADSYRYGQEAAIVQMLPVIDTIGRAIDHVPADLADNKWAQGIVSVAKKLDKTLADFKLERIPATAGTEFNPDFHEAIQFDEDSQGETEVISDELQAGYTLNGRVVRHAMVKV
ncbi:MAG: nucleotide exchange factor GrpE, partial [bacterium]|nr:nucleotide exchange factor GrpE [bacterium]